MLYRSAVCDFYCYMQGLSTHNELLALDDFPEKEQLSLLTPGAAIPLRYNPKDKGQAILDSYPDEAHIQELLDEVSLSFSLAEELDICHHPLVFASPVTAFAYLSGRNVSPEQQLYDDTWGEVILMAGLPGTGKDSWIQAHCPQLPVVSMDEIRIRTGISPVGPQEEVVRLASEMAKEYFRQKQSFVWNATSISQSLRQNQLNLFHRYHARVRICYLETDWETGLARNRSRKARVPPSTIERMLDSLEPPERWEAQTVEWHCV